MNKRQTRLFFVGGTTLFAIVFVILTIDSHSQFGRLTHEEALNSSSGRWQARVAPQGLHQLPHAARRRRLLRARPHENHAAARRAPICGSSSRIRRASTRKSSTAG